MKKCKTEGLCRCALQLLKRHMQCPLFVCFNKKWNITLVKKIWCLVDQTCLDNQFDWHLASWNHWQYDSDSYCCWIMFVEEYFCAIIYSGVFLYIIVRRVVYDLGLSYYPTLMIWWERPSFVPNIYMSTLIWQSNWWFCPIWKKW